MIFSTAGLFQGHLQMTIAYRNEQRNGLVPWRLIGIGMPLQENPAHLTLALHRSNVEGACTTPDGFRPISSFGK